MATLVLERVHPTGQLGVASSHVVQLRPQHLDLRDAAGEVTREGVVGPRPAHLLRLPVAHALAEEASGDSRQHGVGVTRWRRDHERVTDRVELLLAPGAGGHDQPPVPGLGVVVRAHQAVVERVQVGELGHADGEQLVVHDHAHQPARQVAAGQGRAGPAVGAQLGLGRLRDGQAAVRVLLQRLEHLAEACRHEGLKGPLGLDHVRGGMGSGQHDELTAHPPALGQERGPVLGDDVLQGVEGDHDVEGLVVERQLRAIHDHEVAFVVAEPVHDGQLLGSEEELREPRGTTDLQHAEGSARHQAVDHLGGAGVPLVLVERQPQCRLALPRRCSGHAHPTPSSCDVDHRGPSETTPARSVGSPGRTSSRTARSWWS